VQGKAKVEEQEVNAAWNIGKNVLKMCLLILTGLIDANNDMIMTYHSKSVIKNPAIKPGQAKRDCPSFSHPCPPLFGGCCFKDKTPHNKAFMANKNRSEHNAYSELWSWSQADAGRSP
jgi:hypothetical protein